MTIRVAKSSVSHRVPPCPGHGELSVSPGRIGTKSLRPGHTQHTARKTGQTRDTLTARSSGSWSARLECRCMARPGTPTDLMAIRAGWARIISQIGSVKCRRCGKPIRPGDKWELGHPPDRPYASGNRDQGLAPEHLHCNKSGLLITQQPTFSGWN